MTDEELLTGRFCNEYFKDGLSLIVSSVFLLCVSVIMLCGISLWLFFSKPVPVDFKTLDDWRVVPLAPLDQPYITQPILIQWVSNVLPETFTLDFVNYEARMRHAAEYFTSDGWKQFQKAIEFYAGQNALTKAKLFVNASAAGAPFILNQGMIHGTYGWWIQMPLNLIYSSSVPGETRSLTVQALVVRVSTLNDLKGVKIDNIIVKEGSQSAGNE